MPYERETERGDMQTERVREAATRDEIDFVSEILFSSMGLFQKGHKAQLFQRGSDEILGSSI